MEAWTAHVAIWLTHGKAMFAILLGGAAANFSEINLCHLSLRKMGETLQKKGASLRTLKQSSPVRMEVVSRQSLNNH